MCLVAPFRTFEPCPPRVRCSTADCANCTDSTKNGDEVRVDCGGGCLGYPQPHHAMSGINTRNVTCLTLNLLKSAFCENTEKGCFLQHVNNTITNFDSIRRVAVGIDHPPNLPTQAAARPARAPPRPPPRLRPRTPPPRLRPRPCPPPPRPRFGPSAPSSTKASTARTSTACP